LWLPTVVVLEVLARLKLAARHQLPALAGQQEQQTFWFIQTRYWYLARAAMLEQPL
jgi:hypothetical protein